MALVWLPLDAATIDALLVMARSSWSREDLDTSWRLAGWPAPSTAGSAPGGEAPSQLVYEQLETLLRVGARTLALTWRDDAEAVGGFVISFAVFCAATDPADPNVAGLVQPQDAFAGWQVDGHARQDGFDAMWAEGCQAVAERLGLPQVRGSHHDRWRHAVWRIGDRLLIVAQGEDFESYSFYEAVHLALVELPPATGLPAGDEVYAAVLGDWSGEHG